MTGNSQDEQLISFFVYALFIYPVTDYLISPSRSWSRWNGIMYAGKYYIHFLFHVLLFC